MVSKRYSFWVAAKFNRYQKVEKRFTKEFEAREFYSLLLKDGRTRKVSFARL
jgi:hypothetical protein